MNGIDVLADGFSRVHGSAHAAVVDLTPEQLAWRADPEANSIAWLVWHLARVQDDHVADLAGREQVWTGDGWQDRFGLPFDARDTGYGHTPGDVARVRVEPSLLTCYLDAVHEQSVEFVSGVREEDLGRIVDERWDPPVTLGVRLVSIINDDDQHVGQAAYARGLLERQG